MYPGLAVQWLSAAHATHMCTSSAHPPAGPCVGGIEPSQALQDFLQCLSMYPGLAWHCSPFAHTSHDAFSSTHSPAISVMLRAQMKEVKKHFMFIFRSP